MGTLMMNSPKSLLRVIGSLLMCAGLSLHADAPEATITSPSNGLKVNQYQEIQLTASSTDSVGYDQFSVNSYTWDFGNGDTGAGSVTQYSYPVPGTYTVKLTVSYSTMTCSRVDIDGNCTGWVRADKTATGTRSIVVLPPPQIASFSASTSSVEVGKSVTLSWATTNATSVSLSGVGDVTGLTSAVVIPKSSSDAYILSASGPNGVPVSRILGVSTYSIGVAINPASAIIPLGGTQTFTGTVTPTNKGVTWSSTGGSLGTETGSGGTYTRVFTGTTSGAYAVKVASIEDPTRIASASILVGIVTVGTPVAVPADARTYVGGTVSFTSLVSGAIDKRVTWSVSGGGTISTAGVFNATTKGSWTIKATSVADPTKFATRLVTVLPVVVTVTPATAKVQGGRNQALTAAVAGIGTPNQAVTWSVVSAGGGTITSTGVYTAPTTPGDYVVKATSVQDTTCSGTATIHVPGWVLKWRKDVVYVGTKEIAEVDAQGMHFSLVDHLGSPRFLVNASGVVEAEQKFLPFGESLADNVSAAKFAKGFTNHEQTDASGLIYMQARFYAPWYGRFLSPDPARDQHFEETQSWNIYSYVQNNPVMMTDPTGMLAFDGNIKFLEQSKREESQLPSLPSEQKGGVRSIPYVGAQATPAASTAAAIPAATPVFDAFATAAFDTAATVGTGVLVVLTALLQVTDASPSVLAQQKAKQAKADDAKKDADAAEKAKTEATPTTHPDKFKPVKGTKAKKNPDTGEVWEKDKLHKDHYEVYKNRKQFDKGVRDRDVWEDGRPKRCF